MGDPLVMRGLQGFGDLLCVVERCLDGQRPFESLTLHQLHHQRVSFKTVNRGDIGMVQRSQHFGLPPPLLRARPRLCHQP